MATKYREASGTWRFQWTALDGRGRSGIRMPKMTERQAESCRLRLERLISARLQGHVPDDETSRWVAQLSDKTAADLTKVGLIPQRASAALGPFLEAYVTGKADVKQSTKTVWGHTRRCLLTFFGPDKLLRDITAGDAEDWRQFLIRGGVASAPEPKGLASNTVRRRCGIAKQFFNAAVRRGLIPSNPFVELVAKVQANMKRAYLITPADAQRVLDACPDAEWRLLFALSRYGGLRCPSEHLALTWNDVDWERGRLTIHSPKTEHLPGGESRVIPLFPELRPYLEDAWDLAKEKTGHIITRYRRPNANLRTQLERIIRRAGLTPWPKLFQNLRSTRQTELAATYPVHLVCAWIGNTEKVALKHYLQVTDADFEKAAQTPTAVVQNPVQHGAAPPETEGQGEHVPPPRNAKCPTMQGISAGYTYPAIGGVGDRGLEPLTSTV